MRESREGTLEWVPYDEVLSKPNWEGDYEIFKWILKIDLSSLQNLSMIVTKI